jgi:hypothetical protein
MEYLGDVDRITRTISHADEVDHRGRSREDYRQDLILHIMRVRGRWAPLPPPKLYMFKSLWRAATTLKYERWREASRYTDGEIPEGQYVEDERLAARAALRTLFGLLRGDDRELALRLVEGEGIISEIYDESRDGTCDAFRQRIHRLRVYMRYLLGGTP